MRPPRDNSRASIRRSSTGSSCSSTTTRRAPPPSTSTRSRDRRTCRGRTTNAAARRRNTPQRHRNARRLGGGGGIGTTGSSHPNTTMRRRRRSRRRRTRRRGRAAGPFHRAVHHFSYRAGLCGSPANLSSASGHTALTHSSQPTSQPAVFSRARRPPCPGVGKQREWRGAVTTRVAIGGCARRWRNHASKCESMTEACANSAKTCLGKEQWGADFARE
ncbi:uncharacterized protein BDZ83DRAFT_169157 [Colletotrichum acutatum]|uniref:Uncharacterized protein n=1 Tax=Glomerella acutata TaxID=27357 RepID=A0AAD8XJF4_GLOAC|nr:uncharacterized protein BDZ83DRAFT_169157 [Colletotrichum acutatum]KAK1727963.1 hypothetical protein BDZ83DRAFT_169157 [Colletotrichum acutatum]